MFEAVPIHPEAKRSVLGPIHKAGFLSHTAIYALSADQQFSIYPLNTPDANDGGVIQPVSFGDLRPTAQCSYVIDVLRDLHQPFVVVGSNLRCEN